MRKKFTPGIPKKPIFKSKTYMIPSSYEEAYRGAGITSTNKHAILFHVTQFGGFRVKERPPSMRYNKDFMEKWFKHEQKDGYHHFRANACFLSRFGGIEINPLEKIWRNQVLNYDEMAESGFSNEEIYDSIEFLSELNNFYSSLRLNIPTPQSGITAEDRIQLSRFHAIPYLVKRPKAGGRFFHPETSYQRISSSLRPMMTINGEETSEIDLSAATLQFLNVALENHLSMSIAGSVLAKEDPYDYFLSVLNSDEVLLQHQEQLINRDSVKNLVYTTVFSSNGNQERNVDRKLLFMNRNYKHSDLVEFFPDFFNSLFALFSKTNLPLHMVIFREESRYAQEILQKGCLESRIPILPIHDSFLTTVENTEYLKEIMDSTSEKLLGRRLIHKQKY